MALELSTIGSKVKYKVGTGATFPSTLSGFTEIPDIVSISEDNAEAENIDVTNLVDTRRRAIPGLLGSTDAMTLTANFTVAFKTAWETLLTAAETARAAGNTVWFEFTLPGHSDSWYIGGMPQAIGYAGAEVGQAQQLEVRITKNDPHGYASAST